MKVRIFLLGILLILSGCSVDSGGITPKDVAKSLELCNMGDIDKLYMTFIDNTCYRIVAYCKDGTEVTYYCKEDNDEGP